jgi:hypothetical protein
MNEIRSGLPEFKHDIRQFRLTRHTSKSPSNQPELAETRSTRFSMRPSFDDEADQKD